ncbi:MAG: N-acetylneuraminate synthase family protein [Spirochaetes bacterium]|nr:N-acetylneuraminate synthase family protein [Spirochaetota bacterium]
MQEIIIKNKILSVKNPAYIVAEIGLNHNKDMDLAKNMVNSAKEHGADAVKFQTYITDKLLSSKNNAYNIFKNLELSKEELKEICIYCDEIDITFFSTPFCPECVDSLEDLNVPCYKIASMDINYYELISSCAKTGKPVILSTGMSTLGDIEKAVNTVLRHNNEKIIILHAISKYPPEHNDMNMNMIKILKKIFPYPVGFSDHSMDNISSIIARTMQAVMFEKHFTLDKKLDGPDHSISLEPHELLDLRKSLDIVDKCFTESKVRADMNIKKGARRSLYINSDLKKGSTLERNMIDAIRPENGLPPEFIDFFIGKKINKDISQGDLLDFNCI